MNAFVVAFLVQDGLANGAIYCLLAVALVLVFALTRVIFIPQGEFVSFAALGFAAARDGRVPGTVGLLLVLVALSLMIDVARGFSWVRVGRRALPATAVAALGWLCPRLGLPAVVDAVVAVAVVAMLGPLLYRIVFRRLTAASPLVLLIVAVAAHLVLLGLGLYFFGPEGARTAPLIDGSVLLGGVPLQAQTLLIFASCAALVAGLFGLGERSLYGKALRAAAINPLGSRLMGVSAELAGEVGFLVAALIGGVSGVLISSNTTLYYDSGFLLGLKGFVAGILGGLVSFPLAGVGAFGIGLLESFVSFYASSFKEVFVFSMILPALMWRSLYAK